MNTKRTATRSRLHLKHMIDLLKMAMEDRVITPAEERDILSAAEEQLAFAAVIDIRDGLDRVCSPERLEPMLAEYRAWTARLPEAA